MGNSVPNFFHVEYVKNILLKKLNLYLKNDVRSRENEYFTKIVMKISSVLSNMSNAVIDYVKNVCPIRYLSIPLAA